MTNASDSFRTEVPLVCEVVRGDVVESETAIDVVVVDDRRSLVALAGSRDRIAYFRSSLKPIQAAASMQSGWEPRNDAEIAIACSSHNGEPEHLGVVRSLLGSVGLSEDDLRCPPAFPMLDVAAATAVEPRKIFRDCSGKHAGFLAACVAGNWSLERYLDQGHPVQRAVLELVATMANVVSVGVDGCGAPTPGCALIEIAGAFGEAMRRFPSIARAMRNHPFLVAGSKRICTDVMSAHPSLVMKSGAEGIVCVWHPESGYSLALKARDGASRFVAPATMAVLDRLGLMQPPYDGSVARHAQPDVLGGGRKAGSLRVRMP